jgi:zinc/manganese transport system permease protein
MPYMISSEIFSIIGPALLAGLIITITHAPMGIEVLKRGIIFIDLAVAQIAGLGLLVSNLYLGNNVPWLSQIIALSFAIIAAFFFKMIENRIKSQQEAIIGVSFVLAASLAILLLADHPTGGEEIRHLLSGQILFITWSDVLMHLPIYILILVLWFLPINLNGIGCYILFSLAITSSVQLVGVYVVFASLILPALSALNMTKPYKIAWISGLFSVILGILCSMIFDLPAGPILVVSYVIVTILIVLITKINNSNFRSI